MSILEAAPDVMKALRVHARPRRAALQQDFFRTGPGGYGEGDRFLGLTMPEVRSIAKRAKDLDEDGLSELLTSPWHEARLTAAVILAERSKKAAPEAMARIAAFYWRHRAGINNWDLVDASAEHTLGRWLIHRPVPEARAWLTKAARRGNLWERRMAVLATFHLIRNERPGLALELCRILRDDEHDLIHKATGWMLREIGKRDVRALRAFLKDHSGVMPRTMLRYAIEKLPPAERKRWMGVRKN